MKQQQETAKRPFFSVVMPVYNTASYLSKAIESVLNQSFADFELIIMEDHSTDESYSICRRYAASDARIRLDRTEKNQGVSMVRTKAVSLVRGQYCTFVDSDDWIERELLSEVYTRISATNADIVKYSVEEEYYDKAGNIYGRRQFILSDADFFEKNEVRAQVVPIWLATLFAYLCNAFYQVDTLQVSQWKFSPTQKVGEDLMKNLEAFSTAASLSCMSFCGYHYAKRPRFSLSTMLSGERHYQDVMICLQYMCDLMKKWKIDTEALWSDIDYFYIKTVYQTLCRALTDGNWKEARRVLHDIKSSEEWDAFSKNNRRQPTTKRRILHFATLHGNDTILILLALCMKIMMERFRVVFSYLKA